jgi:UDP-N-acetyl-D-mannosaminuronic acid dehydrogenase
MQKDKKNTLILGMGYVGLTLGTVMAENDHNVYGIDTNKLIIDTINNGKAHFYEKGIDNKINLSINKTLFVSDSINIFKDINFSSIIITVGTPLTSDQKPNYEYLKTALNTIKKVYNGNQLIILRSTVSVGTTKNIVVPILSDYLNIDDSDILISFCPERTVEGKALEELTELPQIISGNNSLSIKKSRELFKTFNENIVEAQSLESAEIIKLFNNTYRDVNFAIGNIFNEISQKFGIDGYEVIEKANFKYNRSSIALPGLVGGPCLEKDPYILTTPLDFDIEKNFVVGARKYNESIEDKVCLWVEKNYSVKSNILVSGLAFKGRPETSDLRGSPSISIAKKLKAKGYNLTLHDFCVSDQDLALEKLGDVLGNFSYTNKNFGCILVLTNHLKYQNTEIDSLFQNKDSNIKIFDLWNNFKDYEGLMKNNIITLGNYAKL